MSSNLKNRKFLFLQGPNSYFFKKFGEKLFSEGVFVRKINFCGGDNFFWNDKECISFSDEFSKWQKFLNELDSEYNFTDIVLYGDCREYHKVALQVFHDRKNPSKKIHVFEEGYFRPHWITYELNGVNNNSSLPREASFYKRQKVINSEYKELKSSFKLKAFYTCLHYIYRSFLDYKLYPNYVPHRKINPEQEGGAWLRKGLKNPFRKLAAKFVQNKILNLKNDYFLFALQLCSDSQIKEHSTFSGMRDAIEHVIEDFSKNADSRDFLVVKTHPEEAGISKLSEKVKQSSKDFAVQDRVIFIDGGNMPELIKYTKAMVTVNSTATVSAMHHKRPVKCLGKAIYNFEGLADQKSLSQFWKNPEVADREIFEKFRSYVHEKTQINGSFYSNQGIDIAIDGLIDKI